MSVCLKDRGVKEERGRQGGTNGPCGYGPSLGHYKCEGGRACEGGVVTAKVGNYGLIIVIDEEEDEEQDMETSLMVVGHFLLKS